MGRGGNAENRCWIPSKCHGLPIPPPMPHSTQAGMGFGQDEAQPQGPKGAPVR